MYKLDMTTMNITIDKTGAPGTSYEQVGPYWIRWFRAVVSPNLCLVFG